MKGQRTTADYLPWNEMLVLVQKLARDKDYDFAVLIAVGSYTGLRISDLRTLRWHNLSASKLEVVEKKTAKLRKIHLHEDLQLFLHQVREQINPLPTALLFDLSLQYTNRKLKRIAKDYQLDIRFSTHTFRKTFGRRIWAKNDYSEKALILLGQIFNHSSVAITKRYLGIRDNEIRDVYLNL